MSNPSFKPTPQTPKPQPPKPQTARPQIQREGTDLTIVASGKLVGFALQAAAELDKDGVSVEVVNLRSIKPLDRETIAASVKKTHRLLTVEEGWPQHGLGSEIIAVVVEEAFDDLDAPPERVCGVEIPMPYATPLEDAALPHVSDIVRVARRMFNLE